MSPPGDSRGKLVSCHSQHGPLPPTGEPARVGCVFMSHHRSSFAFEETCDDTDTPRDQDNVGFKVGGLHPSVPFAMLGNIGRFQGLEMDISGRSSSCHQTTPNTKALNQTICMFPRTLLGSSPGGLSHLLWPGRSTKFWLLAVRTESRLCTTGQVRH